MLGVALHRGRLAEPAVGHPESGLAAAGGAGARASRLLQTLFIALAWRNILRAAYPKSVLPYREILSYYAGGNGLNAILPASAGTVAMLGLFRTPIAGLDRGRPGGRDASWRTSSS